jgi:hypothetical protein
MSNLKKRLWWGSIDYHDTLAYLKSRHFYSLQMILQIARERFYAGGGDKNVTYQMEFFNGEFSPLFSGHQKITARDNNGAICHSNQNRVWDYTTGLAIRRHHYPRRNFSYYLLLLGPMTRSYLTQKMEKRFLGWMNRYRCIIPLFLVTGRYNEWFTAYPRAHVKICINVRERRSERPIIIGFNNICLLRRSNFHLQFPVNSNGSLWVFFQIIDWKAAQAAAHLVLYFSPFSCCVN